MRPFRLLYQALSIVFVGGVLALVGTALGASLPTGKTFGAAFKAGYNSMAILHSWTTVLQSATCDNVHAGTYHCILRIRFVGGKYKGVTFCDDVRVTPFSHDYRQEHTVACPAGSRPSA